MVLAGGTPDWPAHRYEQRPWRPAARGGTREDRVLTEITVAIPPRIAELDVRLGQGSAVACEAAVGEISRLDSEHGAHLEAFGALLVRTESVASSKIEQIEAGVDDYARAMHGVKANPSASAMVAATTALDVLVRDVERRGRVLLETVLASHSVLLEGDPAERDHAGRLRDLQNWVGGSDHSPRGALFIPPPPDAVPAAIDDLLAFANRDDLPVIAQAAIAHAQFESIHPFTDGNGRIGRGLMNAILRRRGITSRVVVPLASALAARRDAYFELLGTYRAGLAAPLIDAVAKAARIAAGQSRITAARLAAIPDEWRGMTGPIRAGSSAARLLDLLVAQPVITADDVSTALRIPDSSVHEAIARLHAAGVIRPLTNRRRGQVWGAGLVLAELDDLNTRIAVDARPAALGVPGPGPAPDRTDG